MSYEIVPFPFAGTIDADGHVIEPVNLWEEYLEERYRPRAAKVLGENVARLYGG